MQILFKNQILEAYYWFCPESLNSHGFLSVLEHASPGFHPYCPYCFLAMGRSFLLGIKDCLSHSFSFKPYLGVVKLSYSFLFYLEVTQVQRLLHSDVQKVCLTRMKIALYVVSFHSKKQMIVIRVLVFYVNTKLELLIFLIQHMHYLCRIIIKYANIERTLIVGCQEYHFSKELTVRFVEVRGRV